MKSAVRLLPLIALLLASPVSARNKKEVPNRVVDSGSFGIFVAGRRVGTEKFEITQDADGSITRAELMVNDGTNKAEQKSELQLTPTGALRRYTWNEVSPNKAEATVVPDDQFLTERLVAAPADKPITQPFILPPSTAILDDYFFSQRELLAWRYLGENCTPAADGQIQCKLGKSEFGALIPRQRASVLVSLQYAGKETVTLHGKQVKLDRIDLIGDGINWSLWLDDAHRLQRVVTTDGTEVVRD